jgi:hypothetical protein
VLRDGKFTLQGFLTIFDVFISQNRLEVPWAVLRNFGHDDELNLVIPEDMSRGDDFSEIVASEWRLSAEEESFLTNLFYQYDCDKDGVLVSDETRRVFSVLPTSLPPWSERGKSVFRGCPSMPKIETEGSSPSSSMLGVPFDSALEMSPLPSSAPESSPSSPSVLSASGITISSSPLPSVDVSKDTTPPSGVLGSRPLSYLNWMNHWHMLCTISPSICRVELYRLGYVYDPRTQKQGRANQVEPVPRPKTTNLIDGMPSVIVRALIVGSKVSGSAALIQKFHGKTNLLDTSSDYPETSCAVLKILLPEHGNSSKDETKVETAVHLILTRMPLDKDINNTSQQTKLVCLLEKGVYDLALLVYDSSDSFDSVKHFEATMLNDKMPRIFVSTSPDQIPEAIDHCQVTKMDPPRFVAVDKSQTDSDLVEFLVNFAKRPRRNTSKRRKLIWLGGLVTAGITVVIGFTIGRKKKADGSEKSWLKCLLDLVSY